MKLGNKVTFQTDYIKAGENFDFEFMEKFFPEDYDEAIANGFIMKKLKRRRHEKPKVGIVVATRLLALETRFEYTEDGGEFGSGDWYWRTLQQPKETFYLVATSLTHMYKVKPKDLEIFMNEDPIQGLMDE